MMFFSHQVVTVGVMHHPPLLHHCGAFPLGVLDRLNNTHQGDVTAGGWAGYHKKHILAGVIRFTVM